MGSWLGPVVGIAALVFLLVCLPAYVWWTDQRGINKRPPEDPWADWKKAQATLRAIHRKEHSDWDTEFENLVIMKQGTEHRKNVMAFANALERRARDELYAKMQNEVVRLHESGKHDEARDTLARLETIQRLDAQKGF